MVRWTGSAVVLISLIAGCGGPGAGSLAEAPVARPYHTDQAMLRLAAGVVPDAFAAELGLRVVRISERTGLVAVSGTPEALGLLAGDARVESITPMGRVLGLNGNGQPTSASTDGGRIGSDCARREPLQWHLDAMNAPCRADYDVSEWVVAVVGSGVAYTDAQVNNTWFRRATSLNTVPQVAGWDFVDNDAQPLDLNGHETHIATSIVGDGPNMEGVAAGATLMPVRVLDADNVGTELDLIDGIYYAADNGADVINLSLAFPDGYLPSAPLRRALFEAWQNNVVIVAAAGNEGADAVAWPAASPFVVAAGASRLAGSSLVKTDYSSASYALDVLTPGGDLQLDDNGDLYPDGILAESIDPTRPWKRDLWFFAGTSQAAALTSGAIVHLLEAGAMPKRIPFRLQAGARAANGEIAELLDVAGATTSVTTAEPVPPPVGYHVAVLAYLQQEADGTVTPKAQVTVLDTTGAPVTEPLVVMATVQGANGNVRATCVPTGPCGQCTLVGPNVQAVDELGQPRPLAFGFQVEAVSRDGLRARPRGAVFVTDELQGITASLRADATLADAVLGFVWTAESDPVLGDLAPGVSVTDAPGAGTTTPLAVVFNAEAVSGMTSSWTSADVPVDGTGIVFLPVTEFRADIIQFDPAGAVDAASATTIVALDGSGLANIGFSALDFLAPTGTGATCDASAVLLAEGDGLGTQPVGTPVGDQLAEDGWINGAGYPGATSLFRAVVGAPARRNAAANSVGSEPL